MLDALTYAGQRAVARAGVRDRIELVQGDVADAALVDRLVADADLVVHFAAETHNDNSLDRPVAVRAAPTSSAPSRCSRRCAGTTCAPPHLHRRGLRRPRARRPERFTEATPYNPSSPYSSTKAGADLLVRAWVRSFGINATISNCSNNYGPYQHVEKFIPRQITNVLDGVRPKLYGDGLNVRDWIHVDDHNAAVWTILEQGPHRRDLPDRRRRRADNREVVAADPRAARPAGRRLRPRHRPRPATTCATPSTPAGCAPSSAGSRGTPTSATGSRATIDWYRDNEEWWRPQKAATEAKYARSSRSYPLSTPAGHRCRRQARPRPRRGGPRRRATR